MSESASVSVRSQRRADLDWLRVLAVLLLVPFHTAIVFDQDPNAVVFMKDTVNSEFMVQLVGFIHRWHMPLLFVIAGASTWFALGRRSDGEYVAERVARLLVPFAFGVLTLVPIMLNIHWLGQPGAPSLGEMYARFFTLNPADLSGVAGTFAPGHLWFIIYLFLYSLLGLGLFRFLRRPGSQRTLAAFAAWPGAIYCFVMPLALASVPNLGAQNPLYYLLVFLSGYILMATPRFQEAIDRSWLLSLVLALGTTLGSIGLEREAMQAGSVLWFAQGLLYVASRWIWVLAILGMGHRWFNRETAVLRYASEAAYPFYILHEPVDTLVAWFVVRLQAGVAVKFMLIVLLTTLVTLALYELLVRRIGVLRFLFGMKTGGSKRKVTAS